MKIIAGLGNPGEKYNHTRHNAGFMALDVLARNLGEVWTLNKKFNSFVVKSTDAILVKPQAYMNNSGRVIAAILSYYKLLPKKLGILTDKNSDLSKILTVIHDDVDIELGKYKIAAAAGSAGHNGINSIIAHLKTKNFTRIRIGIKTELKDKVPTEKFVLQKFNQQELQTINQLLEKISTDITK